MSYQAIIAAGYFLPHAIRSLHGALDQFHNLGVNYIIPLWMQIIDKVQHQAIHNLCDWWVRGMILF
jgi:hypothetical protein